MRKPKDPNRKSKHRKRFQVIMEIVFMALGIVCGLMPSPFPILVPIIIGTIRIISNAEKEDKEPPATPTIVYCRGEKEPTNTPSNGKTVKAAGQKAAPTSATKPASKGKAKAKKNSP